LHLNYRTWIKKGGSKELMACYGASNAHRNFNGSKSTLVIIAALNEEEGVGQTVEDVRNHLSDSRILVADGGSADSTVKIAREKGAVAFLQEGSGKGVAINQAIKRIGNDIKFVVFLDADFTYPAEFLPEMIRILEENPDIGMVTGNRFNGHFKLKAMKNILYFGNRCLAFTHNMFNGVQMRDPLTGLRVIRGEILRDWRPKSKGFDIEVELNHLVENRGFKILELPIYYRTRLGQKKLRVKHGLSIFKRIMLESF